MNETKSEVQTPDLVVVDLGGTNVRFARARFAPDARRPTLGPVTALKTADYDGLGAAVRAYRAATDTAEGACPTRVSVALAGPVWGEVLPLTNAPWVLRPASLAAELGVEEVRLVNDFGAVAHAIPLLTDDELATLTGPDRPTFRVGVTTVLGPGTGLGVALLDEGRPGGAPRVIETEGGHTDFAPTDAVEDKVLGWMRARLGGRVSVERLCSATGLRLWAEALAALDGRAPDLPAEDGPLWQAALDGTDPTLSRALDRLLASLGSVAGDLALAHGADRVVLAGSVPRRLRARLRASDFAVRFRDKGRFASRMAGIPVGLCLHDQPGLLGAAAAWGAARGATE